MGILLMLTVTFVIVATLAALATTSASPTVRVGANKLVNFSATAFAVTAALTVWLFFWPPT
jgi:hypothetical protein